SRRVPGFAHSHPRMAVLLEHLHRVGIPSVHAVVEEALVGDERRARCPESERRIFNHGLARSNCVEEIYKMIVSRVVPSRRIVAFFSSFIDLLAILGVLLAIVL